MKLKPLHDPAAGPMFVAGLMSGSGSNIRKILEHQASLEKQLGRSPYRMVVIFSNDSRSKAVEIGAEFDVPVVVRDMRAWYKKRGSKTSDLVLRADFDAETVTALEPFGATVAAYGGYMAVATPTLIKSFLGVNVHPADLSVKNEKGARKFTGDNAVFDAILAHATTVASTTHIVEPEVDGGRILMISEPVRIDIPIGADSGDKSAMKKVAEKNQERLKEKGDWVVFPKTLEYIALGRYSTDEKGALNFDGKPVPDGVRLGGAIK